MSNLILSEENPLQMFLYALRAPESKRQYPRRLKVFLDYLTNKAELKNDSSLEERAKVDIAIIPFGPDNKDDEVKVIPDDMFLSSHELTDVMVIFFISHQPGIENPNKINPVIQNGTVSLMNEDKTFYIDASAFPGNSRGPVFIKPFPLSFGPNLTLTGKLPIIKFIGVMG